MADTHKPRLRFFESASGQRHVTDHDRYLYRHDKPEFRANVIGTGTIGQEHIRVATLLGRIAIHGIFDTQPHSMDVACDEYARISDQPLHRYESLEAACNDTAVDALFICTPNFSHIDVLRVAVRSGKAIFLEKPMATTLADALEIFDIASGYDNFVQVGLQYRYKAPYVEACHEALHRGTLGNIRSIAMREFRPPFLDKVNQWNKFNRFSGGTLIEKCCHYFDLINLFAGALPTRVYASSQQAVNYKDFEYGGEASDIDDLASVIIDYDNGIQGTFSLSMFCPTFQEDLTICGDHGRLIATETFDFERSTKAQSAVAIELGEHGASRHTELSYTDTVETSGHHGATWFEHKAFADQLAGRNSTAATPLAGLWSVIVASAAQESAARHEAVDVAAYLRTNGLSRLITDGKPIDDSH
ncbi:MAG: Gfo/Idh/MocA family oxidoreductase [Pseudomonadota bacterium]